MLATRACRRRTAFAVTGFRAASPPGRVSALAVALTLVATAAAAAPGAFNKTAPANGAVGQSLTPTASWGSSSGAVYYEICIDTVSNSACDTTWSNVGPFTSITSPVTLDFSTTYYWQVRARDALGGTTYANSGTWWSFTVGGSTQQPAAFGKVSPASGATGLGSALTLSWGAAAGATSYEVCVDATNDNACSTTWRSAWTSASIGLSGLTAGTYYWQVRALNSTGTTYADGNAWWAFTVASTTQPPAAFGKLSPSNGVTGQGSTVTLSWSALPDAGYWVCWDTTNNNTCDGSWWPNGGGAARALTGLPAGTYYWQVRAQQSSGIVDADNGTWWSFTVR